MTKNISVCLSFDFDAMSLWLANYRTSSPNALSRGEFGRVGALRLLDLLAEHDIRATWFVPGHTIEAFPEVVAKIVAAGHEIGHHGYLHENMERLERDQEIAVLRKGISLIEEAAGKPPVGFRTPSGSYSPATVELLLEHGFIYDSSMMADDFTPYYCRVGDQAPLDGPYVFGKEVDLLELPFNWHLDDYPYFEFVASSKRVMPGLASPSRVFEVWSDEFRYLYEKLGRGIFTLTMHPQVIGRGHRLLMLERLIEHIKRHDGVRFETLGDFARDWRDKKPLGTSAEPQQPRISSC
jgi:peptidoglycan/xylan/chitin deacetylase (PgdA/CDA1 family)